MAVLIASNPLLALPLSSTLPYSPWLPDGNSQIVRSYVFGPSGFRTMAPLRYAAKFDPFLSLDCAPTPSTLAQSKERKGSNFAIWKPYYSPPCAPLTPDGDRTVVAGPLLDLLEKYVIRWVLGRGPARNLGEIDCLSECSITFHSPAFPMTYDFEKGTLVS